MATRQNVPQVSEQSKPAVVLPKTPQRHNPRIRQTIRVSMTFDEAQAVVHTIAAANECSSLSRGDQARSTGVARLISCVVGLGVGR